MVTTSTRKRTSKPDLGLLLRGLTVKRLALEELARIRTKARTQGIPRELLELAEKVMRGAGGDGQTVVLPKGAAVEDLERYLIRGIRKVMKLAPAAGAGAMKLQHARTEDGGMVTGLHFWLEPKRRRNGGAAPA